MEFQNDERYRALGKVIKRLLVLVTGLVFLVLILFGYILLIQPDEPVFRIFSKKKEQQTATTENVAALTTPAFWTAPEMASLEFNPDKEKIVYGRNLIAHTAEFFGPLGTVKKNATNGMNCQNCHLDAGTKVFGNNYGSVFSTYPRYRPRSGSIEDLHKRINDCFERSLNGEKLDTNSTEMKAMTAYIEWLGKDVQKGKKAEGSGLKDMPFLDRAADPAKGKTVYTTRCQSCHMANGEGLMNTEKSAYVYPPLWGDHSYNDGAGLYRLASFAKYIRYNMPFGVSHSNPVLTDEEAWDIAAFVNSQTRPQKDIRKDWPKIEEKPFDHPFGPYADGFSEIQHKFGPFGPIKEKIEAMKKANGGSKP